MRVVGNALLTLRRAEPPRVMEHGQSKEPTAFTDGYRSGGRPSKQPCGWSCSSRQGWPPGAWWVPGHWRAQECEARDPGGWDWERDARVSRLTLR